MTARELEHAEVTRKLRDTSGVQNARKKAARQAILEHAQSGQPIVVWRDGRIVIEEAKFTNSELKSQTQSLPASELPPPLPSD